ncbi:pancreas/duodenum homeobox protein 1 [Oleidesulfovibrio sp.]|uniref:pancreas/duodenum homeobox protein 1 n=1 Tax=Oleidesulfovibrio sp. TaxID=2909707 RepID=UPI003A848589
MFENAQAVFTAEKMAELFPPERTDAFFDALFGGAEEGAYTIELGFRSANATGLEFAFILKEKPGKCLACNLTYGLPQVFARHPIINVAGVVAQIAKEAGVAESVIKWELGRTCEESRELHSIPLIIKAA